MKQAILKLLDILPPKDRLKALVLLVLMLVGTVIDILGVGMIPLYISVIANPAMVTAHPTAGPLLTGLGLTEPRDLLIYGGLALLTIFIIRGLYIIWLQYLQARFINGRYVTISNALFRRYMLADYPFHLQRNSAVLIRNVSTETRLVANQVILPTLTILMQATTTAGIFLMLLWFEPLITLITFVVIGGGGGILLHLLKESMKRHGKIAAEERTNIIQTINEAIGGFKSVAVSFRQNLFLKRFDGNLQRTRNAENVRMVTAKAIRPMTELIAVVGMMAIAFFMVLQNREMEMILPVLSLFAAATIRLMPAVTEIVRSLTQLRFYISALTPVHHDLYGKGVPQAADAHAVMEASENMATSEKMVSTRGTKKRREDSVGQFNVHEAVPTEAMNQTKSMNQTKAKGVTCEKGQNKIKTKAGTVETSIAKAPFLKDIQLQNVTYRYPDSSEHAVHEVSLTINKGEVVGFVGASGAGKSTLVDLILGLLHPSGGVIKIDGRPLQENRPGWMKNIGYIPQFIYLADDTIRRNIAFGIADEQISEEKLEKAVRDAQLQELIKSLPEGLDTKIGESGVRLSGGQRQRIGIARALYDQPDVLIMDEATAALDNITERQVIEAIELLRGERTILMIAHRLSTVQNCDRLYLLENGRLMAEGTYDSLSRESKLFQNMSDRVRP